jgi:TnpA family transposase
MPTNIKILSPAEIKSFDLPPALNANARKELFRPTKGVADVVDSFRSPTNKVGFVLQFGYFKKKNKFYKPKNFHKSEIEFVCHDLEIPPAIVNFDQYDETTMVRHQKIILELLGFKQFTDQSKQLLMQEALNLCSSQIRPIDIFDFLVEYLNNNKIEVPGYYVLANIITTALNESENNLLSSLNQVLTQENKRFLDSLLMGSAVNPKLLRYKLTNLKKASQSLRPMGIKENINGLLYFKGLFEKLEPVISHLNLNMPTTRYYAGLVIKSQTFQMIRREDNKYLLLVCFIMHQYFTLNDYLIDSLIQSSQSARNAASKQHEEQYFLEREKRQVAMKKTVEKAKACILTLDQMLKNILNILSNEGQSLEQRVQETKNLVLQQLTANSPSVEDEITKIDSDFKPFKSDSYYDILESASIKLQNRASDIIKHICFDQDSYNKRILKAINYYKKKDGVIGQEPPIDFLKQEVRNVLLDDNKKMRVSLYKVLLFQEAANTIKSGALNLLHSYKYRTFDNYLISLKDWIENKESILLRAGLTEFKDFKRIKEQLDKILKAHFELTNRNIQNQKNTFVKFNSINKMILTTPPLKEKDPSGTQVADLFPQDRYISLYEILSSVNNVANFTNGFDHWKLKMHWGKPDDKTFFAAIMGLGCNLGIKKIFRISNDIKQATLENTDNWYLTEENINSANNKILEVINLLKIPSLYQKNPGISHTSSDGQKFGVSVDSLNARPSYKYFGQGKGVSDIPFINEKHSLLHSLIIPSSERESTYVLDGYNKNDQTDTDDHIKSALHSTDTHGSTDTVFAASHFMGKTFAPRIKNLRDQQLFSFDARATFKNLGYKIIPAEKIDPKTIEDEWDNILRFMATIKLNHTIPSQLLHRLSSYSREHPLHHALKNLGKIIKTIFILEYIDNLELRQAIEMQLNKTESINKFSKAVFFGNNQEFQQRTKEDQLKAAGCKRLIENAIICWNYLYLSDLIYKTQDPFERSRLIKIIKNGSIVVWGHINLQGEYDFSDDVLKNSFNFSLPKLMELEVE